MRKEGSVQFAAIKLRALMLARGLKEVDLADPAALQRAGISRGFFSKYTNRLLRGRETAAADDPKLSLIARRLRLPPRLLADDAYWPPERTVRGLSERDIQTMSWLRSLYSWYIAHAGSETAHKYLSLDFDVLQRQSEILQGLARALGDEAVIRVFTDSDHEEGRYDREFSRIERLAQRNRGARRRILSTIEDIPSPERVYGRSFLPLKVGPAEWEISFSANLPKEGREIRYVAEGDRKTRRLLVRARMDDVRLAFILAREVAIDLGTREGLFPWDLYRRHRWPCAIRSYQQGKAEVLVNRFAAAILLPRSVVQARAKDLLSNFSYESVEAACRDLGCAPETLLLRIVQLHLKQAHFIRVDAPGPDGPFDLQKLFRGNGLPLQHDYSSGVLFPETWGVMKSLLKFFAADEMGASAASRHVQITRMARCSDQRYICMSLTAPRFGGGAKALCIGFKLPEFKKLYGKTPVLSERTPAVDDASFDVDWRTLTRLERESRRRS